jgi:hypothetical protein
MLVAQHLKDAIYVLYIQKYRTNYEEVPTVKKKPLSLSPRSLLPSSLRHRFRRDVHLEKTNVRFDHPDTWKQGNSNIGTSFTSPKGDMVIFFGEVDGKNGIETALEAVDKIVEQVMTDVEMGDETETQINGIQVVEMEGKGKSNGAAVFVNVSFLNAGGSNIGFVTSIARRPRSRATARTSKPS